MYIVQYWRDGQWRDWSDPLLGAKIGREVFVSAVEHSKKYGQYYQAPFRLICLTILEEYEPS